MGLCSCSSEKNTDIPSVAGETFTELKNAFDNGDVINVICTIPYSGTPQTYEIGYPEIIENLVTGLENMKLGKEVSVRVTDADHIVAFETSEGQQFTFAFEDKNFVSDDIVYETTEAEDFWSNVDDVFRFGEPADK